ncbi:hypothetical protein UT300018_26270 [Clostridium faecium]|uniref:Uncharacterized protein n=1 Tax=Clostridium faecium TaxID=2762223 RepID=A0ABR8YW20_9CLOT|nr:hypothetical protein [Clostridium faecium]MBD8048487.1 hypothetical protein [Clostridium faecium]
MSKKNKNSYGPNEREFLEAPLKEVKAYSLKDYTLLPDNVRDNIVSNNISNQEFDYTYNNGSDIPGFKSEKDSKKK